MKLSTEMCIFRYCGCEDVKLTALFLIPAAMDGDAIPASLLTLMITLLPSVVATAGTETLPSLFS